MRQLIFFTITMALLGCRAPVYTRKSADGSILKVSSRSMFSTGKATRVLLKDGQQELVIEGISGSGDPTTVKAFFEGAGSAAIKGMTGGAPALGSVMGLVENSPAKKSLRLTPATTYINGVLLSPPPPPPPSTSKLQDPSQERRYDLKVWGPGSTPQAGDLIPVGKTNVFWRLRP